MKTQKYYWFNLTIDEVALVSNSLYHDLHDGIIKSLLIYTDIDKHTFSVIVVTSLIRLSKKEVLKALDEIPVTKTDEWWLGDR